MRARDVAACAAAAAWAGVVAGRAGFWRVRPVLPPPHPLPGAPPVVAIVPARDEAALLPLTLPGLLAQDYPGRLHVVVVDDRSTDGTPAVVRSLAAAAGAEVTVVAGTSAPPGWAPKVWALQQGVAAAPPEAALVWLTDADIAHAPDVLRRLVGVLDGQARDLVSVMATLHVGSPAERLTVPAFVYFFGLLSPFEAVRRGRAAAAAGGCVLARRSALARAGCFAAIAGALIDDVALARAVAGGGGRLWLGFCTDVRSLRRYPALTDVWRMVARSAYTQLRHSPALLAGTTAGLALLFAAPASGLLAGGPAGRAAGAAALALATGSYLPMVRFYGLPPGWAATLPVAGLLYAAMTLDSARRHHRGQAPAWR